MSDFDEFSSRSPGENGEGTPSGQNNSEIYHYSFRPYQPAPPAPAETPKKRGNGIRIIALCLIWSIIGGLAGGALMLYFGGRFQPASHVVITPPPTANAASAQTGSELSASEIYRNSVVSCVSITSSTTSSYFNRPVKSSVSGSGFIISQDGYVLTNAHVIKDSDKDSILVTLYNSSSYPATVVGYDVDNDIAILKINVTGLTPVKFGSSSSLSVGDRVYTIGDPLGSLNYTMTGGLVSALNRIINTENSDYISTFQTDAAVNSGNSGGPIINGYGQVVGIVTAKYSEQGVEGLGFALPIDNVLYMINEIIQYGYVKSKPVIGISVSDAKKDRNGAAGAYVQAVTSGSAAEKAGLKAGDVIVGVDGNTISSRQDLFAEKLKHKAGDTVKLKVYRSGSTIELSLTFDPSPQKS